jgi:hypothetical protein
MRLAFISGPYRALTNEVVLANIRAAEHTALKYWKLGYAVICPHKNTSLYDGHLPDEVWLKGDLEILKRCDVIVMMKDWQTSVGSTEELKFALANGIDIIFDSDDLTQFLIGDVL